MDNLIVYHISRRLMRLLEIYHIIMEKQINVSHGYSFTRSYLGYWLTKIMKTHTRVTTLQSYLKTQEWRGYIMKTWNHEANTRVISSRWIMLIQEDDTCNLIEAKDQTGITLKTKTQD